MYYNRRFTGLVRIVLFVLLSGSVRSEQCSFEGDLRETSIGARTDVIQVCSDNDNDGVLEWTYICFDKWGEAEADVVCRRAGFLFSDYIGLGEHSDRGTGIAKLSDVNCAQNSVSLLDCEYITTVEACNYVAAILSSCRKCQEDSDCDGGVCSDVRKCECVAGCMNGGFCFVGECICPEGYSGINCETELQTSTDQINTSVMSTTTTVLTNSTENQLSTKSSIPTPSNVDCASMGNNGDNCTELPIPQNSASDTPVIIGLVTSLAIVSSIAVILTFAIIIIVIIARKKNSSKRSVKRGSFVLNNNISGEEAIYSEISERNDNRPRSEPSLYCSIPLPNFYHTIVNQDEEAKPYEEPSQFRPTSIAADNYMSMVGGEVVDPKLYDLLPRHSSCSGQLINSSGQVLTSQKNKLIEYIDPPNSLPELKSMLDTCMHEINAGDIEIGEEFASGQFGLVYRGNYHTEKGDIPVAIKTLKETAVANTDTKVAFMREAAILAQFHHPNVLRLIGILTTTHQPWMMVTELLKTELRQLLLQIKLAPAVPSSPDKFLTQNLLLKFSQEVAAGMEHLAEKKFIHRDLAARNVLVAKDLSVRVADFGMSRGIDNENDYYTSSGGRVPLRWTAPEAVFYKKFSEKSDVWSFGMTLFEIWSLGDKPWQGCNNEEVMQAISTDRTLSQPVNCPTQVYQVMLDTWYKDPKKRPKFSEITGALNNIKYNT